jgi:hypothetical protein
MALKKDFMYKGILLKECYCRISIINVQKDVNITFQVDIYGDYVAARTPANLLTSIVFIKPIDLTVTTNTFEECYDYLKSREPEWIGSEDC